MTKEFKIVEIGVQKCVDMGSTIKDFIFLNVVF